MRGCIKGYTKGTEKRLTERLKDFIRLNESNRAVFVTLTTLELDPEKAKRLFQLWTKRIARRCDVSGVYVLEFNNGGQIHFHVLLALHGATAYEPTDAVADLLWNAWKDLGDHDRQAFRVERADLRNPKWVLSYIPKADIEPGIPHPDRIQKRSPLAFKDRGMRATYWGVIGRSRLLEKPLEAAA